MKRGSNARFESFRELHQPANERTSERANEFMSLVDESRSERERERGRNTYGFLRYINSDLIIILIDVELRTNERKVSTMSNSFEEDLARKTGLTHIRNELIRSQFLTILSNCELRLWIRSVAVSIRSDGREEGKRKEVKITSTHSPFLSSA